jgi:hypothetical protein
MRILAVIFAATLLTTSVASAGWLCGSCKPQQCCPPVRYACCPKYEKVAIEKSCFDVEPEGICVPCVKLPRQSFCAPRRARVICVNRLTSRTYECGERCVLVWEAKKVCCRCGKPHVMAPPAASRPAAELPPAAPVPEPEPRPQALPPAPPDAAHYFPESDVFGAALRSY